MKTLPVSTGVGEFVTGAGSRHDNSPGAVLRDGVLASLGRPPGLYRVAAIPLWGNFYRVNVMVGDGPTSALINHSYFVETTDDGGIRQSTPPLVRVYPHKPDEARGA
jgi:hypothetical protein